jgi:hypothetical protein
MKNFNTITKNAAWLMVYLVGLQIAFTLLASVLSPDNILNQTSFLSGITISPVVFGFALIAYASLVFYLQLQYHKRNWN